MCPMGESGVGSGGSFFIHKAHQFNERCDGERRTESQQEGCRVVILKFGSKGIPQDPRVGGPNDGGDANPSHEPPLWLLGQPR